jgi:hypothetical protein
MYDDGRHGDGDSGDGVYGVSFRVHPEALTKPPNDWRRRFPGRVGLSITAADTEGRLGGAVAMLACLRRAESFTWWGEDEHVLRARGTQGAVTKEVLDSEADARSGRVCYRIDAAVGPWSVVFGSPYGRHNLTGFHAISFWIKSDQPAAGELVLRLRDSREHSVSATTPGVPIVGEKCIEGGSIVPTYRRVVVPLDRLFRNAEGFRPDLAAQMVLSGNAKVARTYWVDDVRVHLSREDLKERE